MKKFIKALIFAGLFLLFAHSTGNPPCSLWAQSDAPYSLQVASLPTNSSAQKEIIRLKSFKITAQIVPWEDHRNKTWFIISISGFINKEEAIKQGNKLVNNGTIKTYRVSLQKVKEEGRSKSEKPSPPPSVKQESIALPGNSSVYEGPIFSDETKEKKGPVTLKESPISPSVEPSRKPEEGHPIKQESPTKKTIKDLKTPPEKTSPEHLSPKSKERPLPPIKPSKKEVPPALTSVTDRRNNSVYFGPISVREEEKAIRVNIMLNPKIFPEITADKVAEGSRLIVTFKNIGRTIVPLQFEKIQSKTLLSISLAPKGSDCTFIILLNSSFNYEVDQNYYEKEKMYSLMIAKEPSASPNPDPKE